MSFYLQKAKAVLEKATSSRVSVDDTQVELSNGLQLLLKLDDTSTNDAAEFFFPGYSIVEDRIADLEGAHPGLKSTIKLSPPAMTFVIYDGAGKNKVFQLRGATLRGSVAFSIDSKGKSQMRLVVDTKLTREEMAKLHDFLGADIRVSALEMQPDMFGGAQSKTLTPASAPTTTPTMKTPAQTDLEDELSVMTGSDMRVERDKFGWSREELATRLGLSPKSVGRYERGERIMPPEVGENAAVVFKDAAQLAASTEDAWEAA